jgi:GntR family transcriptional regulator/MocR family aminotransferase
MTKLGTNMGPELLLEIDRGSRLTLRAQLEARLREAVRSGRLATGTRLPASRTLAHDLGVSRRLIVDVYAQLLAEGYLRTRAGGGTFVADAAGTSPMPVPQPPPAQVSLDFFPGNPDLSGFPRGPWLRALRAVVRGAPDSALGYPDPRGAPELRRALAGHLGRVRGVVADPEAIVV